jgi:hypothetical protein
MMTETNDTVAVKPGDLVALRPAVVTKVNDGGELRVHVGNSDLWINSSDYIRVIKRVDNTVSPGDTVICPAECHYAPMVVIAIDGLVAWCREVRTSKRYELKACELIRVADEPTREVTDDEVQELMCAFTNNITTFRCRLAIKKLLVDFLARRGYRSRE